MAILLVDSEQAALIEASAVMLEAALTARVARADPNQVISNSLTLQAHKLSTVRALLKQGDPPALGDLMPELRDKLEHAAHRLLHADTEATAAAAYEQIKAITYAAPLPRTASA